MFGSDSAAVNPSVENIQVPENDRWQLRHTPEAEAGNDDKPLPEVSLKDIGNELVLDDILDVAVDLEASDVHLGANSRIAVRINGRICFVENVPPLTKDQAERLIFSMIPNEGMRETLIRGRELDFGYEAADGTPFRVNLFYKRKNLSAVMRRIASKAWSIDDLGIPPAVYELIKSRQGLLLVTGPTGSGKSTSMQAMLEHINQTRVEHIITIEDPIEFIFTPKKSIFSQREIGSDTLSFANALRGAMREDPDVVMIGEMRDPETMMAAMTLAETGHLVFSTLHTSGAAQTVARISSVFPPNEQAQICSRLADTLIGVLSQRLVPRIDKPGRIAIYELMVVTAGIRNLIRQGDVAQIPNAIQAGAALGMIRMEKYAEYLASQGAVREEDYIHFFVQE